MHFVFTNRWRWRFLYVKEVGTRKLQRLVVSWSFSFRWNTRCSHGRHV
jgi:hypothetical protein